VVALTLGGRPVGAQNGQESKSPWSGSLGLAYLATTGNSDTQTLGLDLGLERKPTPWGLEVAAQFNQASDSGVTTAERYYLSGRATRSLDERWQYFAGLNAERNTFAAYDLRTVVETGAKYIVLPGPTQNLAVNGGLTYTDENGTPGEPSTEYVGSLAGLTYQWQISDQATLSQKLTYYGNFSDSANWRLWSTTGLKSSLTDRLAIKLSYEMRYTNQPPPGFETTDTTTSVSLVVNI
jgi:putative salt-induced outer membrane protein